MLVREYRCAGNQAQALVVCVLIRVGMYGEGDGCFNTKKIVTQFMYIELLSSAHDKENNARTVDLI